jgi:peroxiredoxin family protein
MKKIITIVYTLIMTIMLVSCNGYNKIMYDHLGDIENYIEVTGILQEIYYWSGSNKTTWDESTEAMTNNNSKLYASLQFDEEEYMKFCGCSGMSDEFDYTTNYVIFEIIPDNVSTIIVNEFFESVSYGDFITITTSNFIYMDTNFFIIIELIHDESIYLPLDTGLSNFVSYMEENRSLF